MRWGHDSCAQADLCKEAAAFDDVLFRDYRAAVVDDVVECLEHEKMRLFSHCDGRSVLSVQDQHPICSAHDRSKQLGIPSSKSAVSSERAKSNIGGLIDELGLKVERAASADLLQVLLLLRERALEWWEAS